MKKNGTTPKAGKKLKGKNGSKGRLISFREMRQLQKERQAAHVGPGSTEWLKPMGAELSKITLAGKGNIPNPCLHNPGPGQYDVEEAYNQTLSRSSVSLMKGPMRFLAEKEFKT